MWPVPHVRWDVGAASTTSEAVRLWSVLGVVQGQTAHVKLIRHGDVEVMVEIWKRPKTLDIG